MTKQPWTFGKSVDWKILGFFKKPKCDHDYKLDLHHPYLSLHGVGSLKCSKCEGKKTIWSQIDLIFWKSKND